LDVGIEGLGIELISDLFEVKSNLIPTTLFGCVYNIARWNHEDKNSKLMFGCQSIELYLYNKTSSVREHGGQQVLYDPAIVELVHLGDNDEVVNLLAVVCRLRRSFTRVSTEGHPHWRARSSHEKSSRRRRAEGHF
jgi:hypothetical protein